MTKPERAVIQANLVLCGLELGNRCHPDQVVRWLAMYATDVELLLKEVKRLRERSLSCCFCLWKFASLDELKAHSAVCSHHPLATEVRRLQGIVESLTAKKEVSNAVP